jgi:ATP-dependent DNA helicase RecG
LVIVDEQHRFGVMQRFKLMKKPVETGTAAAGDTSGETTGRGRPPETTGRTGEAASTLEPDVLIMTATPIPRTLALTLYGDLDVSVIDELPPGRTPIVTRRVADDKAEQVWEFVRKQVKSGRQAYVVYPVIEEQGVIDEAAPLSLSQPDESVFGQNGRSGAGAREPEAFAPARGRSRVATPAAVRQGRSQQQSLWSGLKAAVQMYDKLRQEVFPDMRVGLLHGRLTGDEKEIVMARFQRGEIDVLVATTVIEVGVDVANANIMVIEHAERFGLSQLHQLRGRIGRGAAKSYCVLMTSGKVSPEADLRLDAMVRTTNGFEIAELDLQLRGPGEFFGTRQAGMPDLRVSNLVRDRDILQRAKQEAALIAAGPSPEIPAEDVSRALVNLRTHWQRRYGLIEVG